MKKILVVLIPMICLGQVNPVRISDKALVAIFTKEDLITISNQNAEPCNGVNWENEIIDSVDTDHLHYLFNSMALDTNGIPCVVYNPRSVDTIMFAWRTDSGWQKEVVESGLCYYGFSLSIDHSNIVHFSYYRRDESLDMTYHCHGQRDSTGWQIQYLDSTAGHLGSYLWDINSSIALDTADLPSIAYVAWNIADSLHYIKYAHYNSISWDTSVVVRDTTWHHHYPLDWSPSLEFDTQNTPHIAFHRVRSDTHVDTLKIGHYDDTLSYWVVESIMDCCIATYPISLKLDSQDYPSIAHGYNAGLAYTWWDGSAWNTDYGIASIGWLETRIRLALDSLDRPHILYNHWGVVFPRYCYKETFWHMCGPVEPDSLGYDCGGTDLNLAFDHNGQPHISYKFSQIDPQSMVGLKYAKGTFVGVAEHKSGKLAKEFALQVFPNPSRGTANIAYALHEPSEIALSIYDVAGVMVEQIKQGYFVPGYYREKVNTKYLSSGIYFIVLKQNNKKISKKFLLIK